MSEIAAFAAEPARPTFAEEAHALLPRLRDTARLIDRMLRDDHRQRYFEALRLKREGRLSTNVTAEFFPDPCPGAL